MGTDRVRTLLPGALSGGPSHRTPEIGRGGRQSCPPSHPVRRRRDGVSAGSRCQRLPQCEWAAPPRQPASSIRMDGGRRPAPRDHERIQRPATQSDPDHPAQPGSQRLTHIVWVIIALSLVTSIKFVMGCLCTLLLLSDAMLCHTSTVYP